MTKFTTTIFIMALPALILSAGSVRSEDATSARERLAASADVVRRASAAHPYPFRDGELFIVMSAETVAGAGFLVRAGDTIFAVTAKHPFPGALPTNFMNSKHEIALGTKLRDGNDILGFEVKAPVGPIFHLVRKEGRILRKGDSLAVVGHEKVLEGKLTGAGLGLDDMLLPGQPADGELSLQIPGKNDLAGNSGAPVILKETGEVIGVLTGAVQLDAETDVDFALLSLELPEPAKPAQPKTVFVLALRGLTSGAAELLPANLLPADVFEIEPETAISGILNARVFLPAKSVDAPHGRSYVECFGDDSLFQQAEFNVANGTLKKLELTGNNYKLERRGVVTAARVEAMFDWFFTNLGEPNEAFLFGEHRNQPGTGSVYCRWAGQWSAVTLGAWSPGKDQIWLTLIATAPATRTLQKSWSTPMGTAVEPLKAQVRKLTRETAALPR